MKKSDWIKREVKNGYTEADVNGTLALFERKKNLLPVEKRDIFVWDAKELEEFFKSTKSNREKRSEDRGKYVKIIENDRFLIVRVDDEKAAEYWGVGTKWCITSEDTTYYSNYRDDGAVFYFLIDKKSEPQEKWSRIAFCVQDKKISYFASDDEKCQYTELPKHIKAFLRQKMTSEQNSGQMAAE